MNNDRTKLCPKCHAPVAQEATDCLSCGINFQGYQRHVERIHADRTDLSFLERESLVRVQQNEDLFRIMTGWQTRNRYVLFDSLDRPIAYIAERANGLWSTVSRQVFGPRRPLEIDVFDLSGKCIVQIRRPWFWFLSTLNVVGAGDGHIGSIRHRFSILRPLYELHDGGGSAFAYLQSTILGGETLIGSIAGNRVFHAVTEQGSALGGSISREWKGALNRAFTAEDTYRIEFCPQWTPTQKLICLAASISIDLDFYDDQKGLIHRVGDWSPLGLLAGRSSSSNDDI